MPQTEGILDVWYGFVGANPHLVATFAGADGAPDPHYLAAVRQRFGQWIDDVCNRTYDQTWLAYQEEIGRRHHPTGKNTTDGVTSTATYIPLRHLTALIVPITMTIRGFLTNSEASAEEVDAMYHAWFKAVTLSVVLWSRPYNDELW
ncbi:protoglobin domain-containing protein [Arthrobacter sp. Soc17.1.1.1]|uniref:protoglobin domain-containing protein n=1 Tax=Arthrobacter sp. Soc17.1.1.1 TaxID=3121277 RepID=UPI002FE487CC